MAPATTVQKRIGPIKSERNRAAVNDLALSGPASSTSSAFHKKRSQGKTHNATASSSSHGRRLDRHEPLVQGPSTKQKDNKAVADASNQTDDDSKGDNDNNNEDDKDVDDIRSKTSLSLAGHQLPPLAALVDTLAQFSYLQRLDLSSIEPSDTLPKGLCKLTWLAKAIFQSKALAKGKDGALGDHLTWLNLASNANLTSDGCIGLEALEELCVLTLSHCALTAVPPSITPLRKLKALVLNNNAITSVPAAFPHLPELNSLILSHNEIRSLPASMPASLPALKKLSFGHNKLSGSQSLPDFSLCLALREVRLNDNPDLKCLPSHVRNWGKGADGKTAPGLELLELKDCGLDTWESLSTLAEAVDEKESQPRLRRKGLAQLLLKGNGVANDMGYKERILRVHPTLRVLDNERLQPRARPAEKDDDEGVPARRKQKQQSIQRGRRDFEELDSTGDESDDDEAAQMAAEMRALRRGKPSIRISASKGRKESPKEGDDDEDDDDEAAQMAAEMRALRRGQQAPRRLETKEDASNFKTKGKPQKKTLEANSEAADRTKAKHKRGTRSGKKVNKSETSSDKLKDAKITTDRSDRGSFFEAVDEAEEKMRLAPIHELSKQRAKIASGRTQVAEGVLEDATSGLSKARQKESRTQTELDTFDDSAPEPIKGVPAKGQGKKQKQKEDGKSEDKKVNTSVAAIVDLRKQTKSQKDGDKVKKRKAYEPERENGERKKVRASLPFVTTASSVGEVGKSTMTDSFGSGADAWGAGGAWA